MNVLVYVDGTLHAKTALRYAIGRVRDGGGELTALHVFQSNLFVDYDGGPGAENKARAEARHQGEETERIIREAGLNRSFKVISEQGDPEEELLRAAETTQADLILAPLRWKGIVKAAHCPVYLVPGTILLPVDSSGIPEKDLDFISQEARGMDSRIILLGIVPVHLYGSGEKKELDAVRDSIEASLSRTEKALSSRGIPVSTIIRSGYPDEEIVNASGKHGVTLVILPSGGKTPSELSKAASMLLDEHERIPVPMLPLPVAS